MKAENKKRSTKVYLNIYDGREKRYLSKSVKNSVQKVELQIQDFPQGVYVVKVR